MDQMQRECSARYLFGKEPILPFRSARRRCPTCRSALKVKKTRAKTLLTLRLGRFIARETLLQCQSCEDQRIYPAEQLSRLAPPGCRFGYDVMVRIGKALFLRHSRAQEIVDQLLERNVPISASEVEYLGKKFVVYLALAHRQSAPGLKQAMGKSGGYILHLDGTYDRGGPMLMSSLDSISEIVLGNLKVPSEKAQELIPFLEQIKARYGTPLAAVHDMGAGILAAVKKVFRGVPDFICHFHFLRDLGKDLFQKDYDAIRKRLRKHGLREKLQNLARRLKKTIDQAPELIEPFCQSLHANSLVSQDLDRFPLLCAYSLIQWALAAKTQGHGYGFPFDRPHIQLAQRLFLLAEQLQQIKDVHLRSQWRDNIPLCKLANQLKSFANDTGLRKMLSAIDAKIQVFDQLRAAMRIAQEDAPGGLNCGSEPTPLGPIEKALEKFRQKIVNRSDFQSHKDLKNMIKQIDKYWGKLFADPIVVKKPNLSLRIQPQRTNNIMERFFRDFRRGARRKSGQNSIGRFLQSMIADTPLVRNLDNPDYLKILLNDHPTLEECFSHIDIDTVRREMNSAQHVVERVPRKIRKLIAWSSFPETLRALFRKST